MKNIVMAVALGFFSWYFKDLLMIGAISISLVYLAEPLELLFRRFSARFSSLLTVGVIIGLISCVLFAFFSMIKLSLENINTSWGSSEFEPYFIKFSTILTQLNEYIKNHISNIALQGLYWAFGFLKIGLIILIAFYLLSDWGCWISRISSLFKSKEQEVHFFLSKIDRNLRSWAHGQFLVFLCLFPYYFLSLKILQFPFAFEMATLSTVLSVIPYLGIGSCAIASVFFILQYNPTLHYVLSLILIFALGLGVEGAFLTPNLIGRKIEIHPILFLLTSLMLWQILGLFGPIITSPLLCIITALFKK